MTRFIKISLLSAALFFSLDNQLGYAQQQTQNGVPAEKEYAAYLFAFFSNNSPQGEQVRYAISYDGFNYKALNDGKPVIASDSIALKKSIRDPHILRSEDGKYFYMVLTDMRSSEGWQSNDGIILLKSTDLIHWQHTAIDFPTRFPKLKGFDRENLHAVWAPQTIWDAKKKKYMIYYSIGRHDWEYPAEGGNQPYFKLYYSYANKDFTDVTEPKLLFDFGSASIDGDIIFDEKNKEYVLFFKDEGKSTTNNGFRTGNGVMRATSKKLTGPYKAEYAHIQCEQRFPVEGSSVFKLIGKDEYVLMYDCYTKGHYQFCKSTDLKNFSFVQNTPTKGNFTPRHGNVIPITAGELKRLTDKWGVEPSSAEVLEVLNKANTYWQQNNPRHGDSFWNRAAYHTGNMAAYEVTKNADYKAYSESWAEHNKWMGAQSQDTAKWKYSYGESNEYVLFGDFQICFQTYLDLYNLDKTKDERKIARAKGVMEYQMSTPQNDYWWWADGLYMVMPVMTKLYKVTGDEKYLDKLNEYFAFAKNLMYDEESRLFYRDAKYVYPKHQTKNGKKDFWARGNGWVFAGLAKVLADLPGDSKYRGEFLKTYMELAQSLATTQQAEGFWTRSILDAEHAPGYETSGTAFFVYGYLWGVNNGYLDKSTYKSTIEKGWKYLTEIALQTSGKVGYVQPIGERADQHKNMGPETTADFGVGAFLLAASEMSKYVK